MEEVHCLLSGGLDSTVLAAMAIADGQPVVGVIVDYGQRARMELSAAAEVCRRLGIRHHRFRVDGVLSANDPNGLLRETTVDKPITTVQAELPGRNALLLSLAATNVGRSGGRILIGCAPGDPYPDSQPEKLSEIAAGLSTESRPILVEAPLLALKDRTEVLDVGARLDAPLAATWSCWMHGQHPCLRCGSCVSRAAAFEAAGIVDGARYSRSRWQRAQSALFRSYE